MVPWCPLATREKFGKATNLQVGGNCGDINKPTDRYKPEVQGRALLQHRSCTSDDMLGRHHRPHLSLTLGELPKR